MVALERERIDRLREERSYSHSVMEPIRTQPLIGSNAFILFSSGKRFRRDGGILENIEETSCLCIAPGGGEYRIIHRQPLPQIASPAPLRVGPSHEGSSAVKSQTPPSSGRLSRGREQPTGSPPSVDSARVRPAVLGRAPGRRHEELRRDGTICPFVFHRTGKPIKSFIKVWRAACRAAGCPGRIPHVLRRTAVRSLERAAVPRSTAMAMVGHKTSQRSRRPCIAARRPVGL